MSLAIINVNEDELLVFLFFMKCQNSDIPEFNGKWTEERETKWRSEKKAGKLVLVSEVCKEIEQLLELIVWPKNICSKEFGNDAKEFDVKRSQCTAGIFFLEISRSMFLECICMCVSTQQFRSFQNYSISIIFIWLKKVDGNNKTEIRQTRKPEDQKKANE